jgi:anti-sigma factor RsiW
VTDCAGTRERITAWLSGELGPDDRRVLEDHLSACASCAADAGRLRQALDLLTAGDVPDPGPVYWSSFGRRLRVRIDAARRRVRLLRWTATIAAAAVIVAGLSLQRPRHGIAPSPRAPTIEEAEARLRDALRRAAAEGDEPIPIETILDEIAPADSLEGTGLAGDPTPEDERRLSDDLLDSQG